MTGAVFILLVVAVAVLVFVAGLTPFLFIPLAVLALVLLIVPTVGGIAHRWTNPDPEEPRGHRPGTAEASYDPTSDSPR
jgi:cell division protein FtsW (lipid II flippase)